MPLSEVAPDRATEKFTFQEYLFYEGKPGEPDVRYELVRGQLVPMPAQSHLHTNIAKFLAYKLQRHFAAENLDLVANPLGTGVRTEEASSRIPDLVVCSQSVWEEVIPRAGAGVLDFPEKPNLVIEIVSTNRRDDYVTKRNEYENAEIPEYWIVDPKKNRVRIYSLTGEEGYSFVDFTKGAQIVSSQFPNLVLSVEEMLSPPILELLIKEELAQSQEFQQRAEAEHQRAEAEHQRAEAEHQRAEAEHQRAEEQQRQAEAERQRAEEQQQRAEKLAQRLLEMGVNPEEID
ncbi:MAG: Uma2 family endonuclease [Oscillatoria sp. SIO1A7]|nr:Uma2 family endonuclease [Oscillatoria sp. SIO1A7]